MQLKASNSKDVSTSENDDIAEIKYSVADKHNKFDKLLKTMQFETENSEKDFKKSGPRTESRRPRAIQLHK